MTKAERMKLLQRRANVLKRRIGKLRGELSAAEHEFETVLRAYWKQESRR